MHMPTLFSRAGALLHSASARFASLEDTRPLPMGGGVSFGDPVPVLADRISDYLGVWSDVGGLYYLPPIDQMALVRLTRANPHHGAILRFKRNMVLKWFVDSPLLLIEELRRAALDYVVLGNAYFQVTRNRLGQVLRLTRLPAILMRRGTVAGEFFMVPPTMFAGGNVAPIRFQSGEVLHVAEPDLAQDVYGVPEYLGGMQSVLLSEDATLFRRKYFRNGAHMGYVFVTTNAGLSTESAKLIEDRINQSVGPGNFRNLYINIPKTDARQPVQIVPVGDIASKDDFELVKAMTMREVLAMHRMQPGIAGVIPENTAGFGDLEKIMRVYVELEVPPLQAAFLGLNAYLPAGARIEFRDPEWTASAAAQG